MGQRNGSRGAQRGLNAAARRSDASTRQANTEFNQTGQVDSQAQRRANRDADGLATIRNGRRHRGA